MWRVLYILAWVLPLIAVVAGQSSPPVITYFLTKDLVNPEDVKFNAEEGFRLPCKATGANLKWSWKHNDTVITPYPRGPYTITEDGTLIGSRLRAADSGTYQCFVKDEKTGAVAFSRKLKVAVTVVGAFINPTDVVMKVNLGDPFTFDCPPRKHSYGVVFSWGNADDNARYTFARNDRRSISSNGTLFITYLTQQDIDDIESYKGIRCIISGANSFQRSGTLKLEKINKNQSDSENSTLPAWSLTPHKQEIAVQGRNKTLYCLATGRPSPKITWKKDGDKIEHSQNSFKISRSFYGRLLFIMNINKEEHEGTYTCEAENDLNEGSPLSFSTALTVEVPPKWAPSPPPKNISVVIETDSTLECHVTADPAPAITWYKDGEELQPSKHHILDGGNLHLAEVTLDDAGIYQCEAANVHGMIISSTSLNVLAWKPLFDNAQFGPFHLLNEKEARLPCQPTTAAPRPTFQWFREGEMLTYNESSRYRLEKDGTLVIKEVDKDHDAVAYTCTAMNLKGEASVSAVLDVLVPPELSVKPGDQTIIEGTTVELHCNATGNPTPKITWSKDGKTVVKGDTLTLETLRNHSGKYWCTAENGLNVTVNASATLDVLFSPSLTTEPSDQTVVENEEVVFSCSAIGNPAPKITWMKDGKTVGTEETLRFEASRDHSGDYWCSADNELSEAVNASAHLDVQFSPRLSTKPSDRTVVENEEVTFTCAATGNPDPKITWIKNGKTVGLGNKLSFLTDRNHSGEYWCTADNGVDEAVNASAFLEVQFSPTLTTKPSTQRVIENEKVTFHCSATGNPAPNITWTKDGKIVAKGDTLSFVTDRSHSGKYWCSADNGLRTIANASAVLDVLYPPSVTTQPSDKTVIENEEATLHCKAIGNPVPEIIWLKDGDIVGSGETLNIEALRRHSGKYWCSADNGLGAPVNASANLDVQFPPSLTMQPKDQTVLETAVAIFFCNATGNPSPNITWTKDGMTVGKGDTLSFVTNRNKSGEYWCSADNGLDLSVNASAKLDVQFPPTFTSKPSDRIVVENAKVTFYCKAIGNPVPDITWINDGTTVASGDTLNIEALRSHSGKYWCSADNGLGAAVNASVDLNVKFPPSLTTQPKDQIVLEGAVATFYCNATGNPAPNITWTKDGMTVGKGDTLSFLTKRNQSGEYWCSADNGLDLPVNASAKLDVQFPPSLTSKPSDQIVVENEEVTFHCTAVGNPVPKIIWVKDGTTVGSEDTLNIKALRSHSGKYWCSADNGLGAAVNASAALDVKFTPSLISRPHDVTIIEGSIVTFHCNAIGNPAPKITWTKDGKTVGTNDTLSFEALRSKSGKYWCSADNGLNSTVNASAIVNVQFHPSFTAKPSDQTVVENQQLTFNCSAIGNPVPKITWMKDGKTVGSEDTLSFETKRYQSGKYWCSADNGLGGPVNVSADLNVLFPPRLTRKPSNQTVIETGTVTFYCNATGNPVPKITWTKDGKTVGTEDTLSFVTHRNHSGEYLCSADNGLNATVVASANLDVQFPPSLIIMPLDQTVIEKEQLTLHCAATGNPVPKISWSKDGKTVGEGDTLTLETLRSHSGKYWCTAENGLSVTVNASATLDVLFPPSLTTIPTNKTVVEGAIATLRCTATGNPTPNITWTKDGKTVSTAEALTFAAFRNQSGEYWCSADNGINKAVNASAYLDVQFLPSLTTRPSDQTLIENQEVKFLCAAIGNPTPTITWIRDGNTLAEGETLSLKTNRGHSGKYWCSASNGLGAAVNASADLDVQFLPSLTRKPSNQTVIETGTVTFYCNATGNPVPKITWTKDGKTVGTEDTLRFVTHRNHSGEYLCSADNGLNATVIASANLDVQFPPSLITKPLDHTVVEKDQLTLHCAATGNPVPKISWSKDGKTVGEGNALTLKTLKSHSGKYWCTVENGLSVTVNASATLDVLFPPSLTTIPTNTTVVEGAIATLRCSATGNPTPNITWTKDGKTVSTAEALTFAAFRNQSGEYWCSAGNGINKAVNASAYLDVQFPPSLSIKPSDRTVVENEEITLHCAATGNPVPKIRWIKDGKTVGTGEKLKFTAKRDHSGEYWCSVENELNITVNASANLDVQFPPSLITKPTDQRIIETDTATFHCNATGNPAPNITWTKDGKTVSTGDTLSFQSNRNDSGIYLCSAENGLNSTVNASVTLDVQFPPSLTTRPSDQTLIENQEVKFVCTAIGNPTPTITWIRDGNTLAEGETLSLKTNRGHSGKYWCSASNGLGAAVNVSADLDVQFLPSIKSKPENKTIIEGSTVTLYCNATSNPAPKITWTKDGNIVGTNDSLSFEAKRNHSGKYWCSADNGLSEPANASADVDVQFLPSIITKPSNQTVYENQSVTIHCSATGNPVPRITWIKDGKTVGTEDILSLEVKREHSGEYWCHAENGLNDTVKASAHLNVQYTPSLISRPSDKTITEGATVIFHCNATGNPTPKITWTKDGKTVGTNDTLSFVTDRNHSGQYWCSAENGLNVTVKASAKLDVQFPPALTIKPTDQTVVENEQSQFHCTAIGNPVPKITWIKDGKTVGNGDSLNIGVQRKDSGKYWCSADNGLGQPVNASAELDVHFPPSLLKSPTNKTILEGTNVTFMCTATGNPTPKIEWLKDGMSVGSGGVFSFVVNRNHSGKYWCSANNGLSAAVNASAELDVQFPPNLITKPSDKKVIENEQLQFRCTATGNPVPKIRWMKDGRTVGFGEILSLGAQRNQSGEYWCSVDNGLSEAVNASADLDVQFAPTLLTRPTDQIILEGFNVTFRCLATGNPTPTTKWFKDGKTVGSGETLSFVANRIKSGKYWCSADNGLGAAVNGSANLDVQFFPSLTSEPADQTVTEKEEVVFHCSAIGNPLPKITWVKDDKTVATGNTLSFEAFRNHSGEYWCSADNGLATTANTSAVLVVQYAPSLITKPTNQTVIEADNATFQCIATGNPIPTITWIKDGKTVTTGAKLSFEAFRNNSGEYWCSADNGLNSTANASAYLNVQFLPSLTTRAANQTVNETAKVTFHCSATGNPVPKITWYKDGNTVGSGSKLSFTAMRNHSGKYWCLANNGLNATVNSIAYLNVQFPPSFTKKPIDKTVTEFDETALHCTAIGNPVPEIKWIKDEKTVGKGSTLNLKASRNKTGEYWCWADNGLGKAIKAGSQLDVQFPPSLSNTPDDQILNEKTTTTFHCTAAGNPVPKITWTKDGKTVGTGNVLIFETHRNHSGKYWCTADNGFNKTVNASAQLDVLFPPSITTQPTGKAVIEGTIATFHCNANGNPVPKITWTKDGKTVSTESTLSFVADRNHSGEYWCSADNGLNTTVNASAYLDVLFPPSLTTTPNDQILNEKASATFHCTAVGNPVPKITWTKDGKTVGTGNVLRFETHRNHSGKYWCTADNGFNKTVNSSAQLNVLFPPTLTTQPTDKAVIESTVATFHCNATGRPVPKITWTKDGKTVSTESTLSFVADRNHSGEYWCSADNGLNTTANASAYLDVLFSSSLTMKPHNTSALEMEIATFYCSANGNPTPKITWSKDGKTVGQGETLNITVNRNDSGKYWCAADNGLREAVNASAYLDVQFLPSFVTMPVNQTVNEGDKATFYCTTIGNPVPKITWSKDGETVSTEDKLSFVANRSHSGEYWCSAENGIGVAINASVYLDVQFAPVLIETPTEQTIIEGDKATFHCTASGNPAPKIKWVKDDSIVGAGETLIFDAVRENFGDYWCVAENGFSDTANASAYLDVQFPPSFTSIPSDQIVTETDLTTFTCAASGNPVPNITWDKDGKTVATGDTLSFEASRNRSGTYWCLADNGIGAKINTSVSLNVQFSPSLDMQPTNQTVIEGDMATLYCNATGNPNPRIRWIKDGKTVGEENTLTFVTRRNSSGKYWCSAENGFNATVKAIAYLNVLFPPSFTSIPVDQTVKEGAEATLLCVATGNPSPEISWHREGKIVAIGDTLRLMAANRNDTGKYWCSADNGLSVNITSSVHLDVQFAPRLTTRPTDQTVVEADQAAFYCAATGNPRPKITWSKDAKTVGIGEKLSFEATRNHSGKYWCSADNGLQPSDNASAVLDVQFPPRFALRPVDQTIKEGDKIAFHCNATGNPVPNITWTKDGVTVGKGDTLSLVSSRNDTGEYQCSADNGIDANITTSVSLDVQFPPRLTATPADQTLIEGVVVTFLCSAIGNPPPRITWTKDGEAVGTEDTLSFVTDRNQSGEYWCSADNGMNATVRASANLDVQFPPHFTTKPVDQTVDESEDTTFHCTATGNPVPTITWIRDGKPVAKGDTLSFEAARNRSGEYWCSANNGLGVPINASAQLEVRFSPSWTNRPADQTVVEGVVATLYCTATGHPTPKITWTKDGQVVGNENVLSFTSSRGHAGEYWCSAENGLGKAINASAYLDVQHPSSLTSTPTDQTVKEGDETTLHCAASGNPTPNITWIKDGKTVGSGDTLKFQATRNRSGKYWCLADNGLGFTVNASAHLNVQFPPHVTIKTSYLAVKEGNTATFQCTATGNPAPRITWSKDGENLYTGDTLSFDANRNHSGEYWCSAENGFNKTVRASSYLDVHFKPERTRLSVNIDIAKAVPFGSFVEFNCTTFSNPDADGYKFYRDQEPLGSNTSGVYHLQLQRSGLYSCVPFNSVANGNRAVLRINVNAWKPSFDSVQFGPFYLFKGIQARLPCKPFAEPYPTFTWLKDGAVIKHGKNESYRIDADGSLIIVKVKDGDSGKYTCMAENYLGKANATADGILLERTQIIVRPQNMTVTEGSSVDLRCKATADPLLELTYIWKRDGADITDESNVQWQEGGNVLKLSDISFEEAGVYTCVAYTPQPRGSEDNATAVVSIIGVPPPPNNIKITDCYSTRTNISWSPVLSNNTRINHYLIEQESNHEPFVFKLIYNVTNPDVTSVSLALPGWATLRFRVRTVNNIGPSRPSEPTAAGICTTPVGTPQSYPRNLRGVPKKANELAITWTPMSRTEWNAQGCYYIIKYRKVNLGYLSDWMVEKISDPSVDLFAVSNAGYYQLWEFKIRAGNHEGLGPESPVRRSFSGQNAPAVVPESTEVEAVTASSVALTWKPVTVSKGSVDGYKIYYWGESRSVISRRRRQAIPSTADFIIVMGGKTQQATLTGLKPYTNYRVVVKAFNTGGEGPASAVMIIETLEGEPGPPSGVQIYPFGEFILVKWKAPKEPNGIITSYQVGSAEINGSSLENVPAAMETVGPNVFKKLLGNHTFEKSYVVEIRAQTSKGWGESARETTRTIKKMAPAKPEKPTAVGTGKDVIRVMYNFGVGGGWTHEFKVLYRKKEEGGEFLETAWVDHFSTQWTEIKNLEPEVYEFKTVGKNTVGTSPESDVTEARPEQGPPIIGQQSSPPVYRTDWFMALIIASACTLLILIAIVVYRRWKRRRSSSFKVTEHEKEMEKEQVEQGVPEDVPVKRHQDYKKTLQDKLEEASQDSLDEYAREGAYFTEDGSFIGDLEQGQKRESVYDEIPDPVV